MPLYEFRCDSCGVFDEWRSMARSQEPMYCPDCDTQALRVYAVGGVILTPAALSRRIEQGAEPKVVRDVKSHSHSHDHHSDRPWMIGH